jgi:AhpD family alkylhydroperoxidase
MKVLNRQIYRSLGEVLTDFRAIWSRREPVREAMGSEGLDLAFRERLMLVVTGVNGCRYCFYAHAREALAEWIAQDEVNALEAGIFESSPSEEVPALLYAQHWAETDVEPASAVRERTERRYGGRTLERRDRDADDPDREPASSCSVLKTQVTSSIRLHTPLRLTVDRRFTAIE